MGGVATLILFGQRAGGGVSVVTTGVTSLMSHCEGLDSMEWVSCDIMDMVHVEM